MWKKIKPFFEFCGAVQFLWGFYGMFFGQNGEIYKDIHTNFNITYEFVYSGMLSIGIITVIYFLIGSMPIFIKRIKSLKIEPDISITDSLNYIMRESSFGTDLNLNEEDAETACDALKSLIKNNKISLFGVTTEKPLLHEVSKKIIKDSDLTLVHNISSSNLSGTHISANLLLIVNNNALGYKNFFVSKKKLKKAFPQKHGR